jgi:hypothetical protein
MTYQESLAAMHKAESEYQRVLAAYRAMTIGDAEFLTARKVYNDAVKTFDDAYAIEAGWRK